MKALVILEHDGKNLNPLSRSAISAARQLTSEVDALLVGYQLEDVLKSASHLLHLQTIIVADHEVYQHLLAENVSELIVTFKDRYNYILTTASTFGKDVMPRVAALMDTAQLTDVTQIIDGQTFVRPIYAGNAFATVKSTAKINCLTIRAAAFRRVDETEKTAAVQKCDAIIPASKTTFVKREYTKSTRPDLSSARVIISGGRGLQNAENFKLIEKIADKLNAAVGATRAAVDAGFVPNDYQVGQTGKIVAPDLYIAVGISGAIQHLAGMKESKVIVAINKDPEAPIFKVADYGLVGDLFEILPELEAALSAS